MNLTTEQVRAYAHWAGTNPENAERILNTAPSVYEKTVARVAHQWIEEMRRDFGIPETPRSWRLV